MKVYHIRIVPKDDWYCLHAEEDESIFSQARTLDEAVVMIRDGQRHRLLQMELLGAYTTFAGCASSARSWAIWAIKSAPPRADMRR